MKKIINEDNKIETKEKIETKKEKQFTIFGFTITRILAYFIVYSILGYIIETVFGLVTKGVIESRQSFLYGPFCGIYGLGAVVMVLGLQRFQKNNYTLFAGGFVIGSLVEYVISFIGEWFFHIKWWDYSSMPFNINGRICVWFSLFWGALAIYLMSHVHPKVDNLLDKIKPNIFKPITIILTVLIFIDFVVTGFALKMFYTRLVKNYNLDIQGVEEYIEEYTSLYERPHIKEFVDKYFSDEKILKTFPNIKVTEKDGNVIWICDILNHIQPYYARVFTPQMPKYEELDAIQNEYKSH